MTKKTGKHFVKFFYHLLVVLFMAMPLMSTLFRCVYVAHNKNAFESYYGETINEEEYTEITTLSEMKIGNWYRFNSMAFSNTDFTYPIGAYAYLLNFDNFNIISTNLTLNTNTTFTYINPYINNQNHLTFNVSYLGGVINLSTNYYLIFDFHYTGNTLNYDFAKCGCFYSIYHNDYSYLDNAFEYSIYKELEQDKDMVLFDFTGFNNGVFIDYGDNIYMEFANFYIGWLLNCAVVSFIPYVLLSFFYFAVTLVDRLTIRKED